MLSQYLASSRLHHNLHLPKVPILRSASHSIARLEKFVFPASVMASPPAKKSYPMISPVCPIVGRCVTIPPYQEYSPSIDLLSLICWVIRGFHILHSLTCRSRKSLPGAGFPQQKANTASTSPSVHLVIDSKRRTRVAARHLVGNVTGREDVMQRSARSGEKVLCRSRKGIGLGGSWVERCNEFCERERRVKVQISKVKMSVWVGIWLLS